MNAYGRESAFHVEVELMNVIAGSTQTDFSK
jgi:hypothetical protein